MTLLIFHFEISGKDNNDEHLENIDDILVAFLVLHSEISGRFFNDLHSKNI